MISNNELVSIVVPIYNAEIYLSKCLKSIASQTYEHLEVILINDGSTDGSGDIARSFCETDTRFKLITQVNSGVAAAREKGLRLVQGKFVIHADSDDLMAEKAIEYLYKSIVDNESDIAIGAYTKQCNIGEEFVTHHTCDKHDFIHNILTGKYHSGLWNKLIRTELCRDISFNESINYMEDKLFLSKVLKKDDIKISIINENVYYYRLVTSSYTNNISSDSISSSIEVTNKVCNIFQDIYSNEFIAHIKNKNKLMVLLNSQRTQRGIFPESNKYLLEDKNIALRHKIIIVSDLLHISYPIKFYKLLSSIKFKSSI
ncbi:glycosyltransferase [uncultured Psychrobacter sp.]|uniref:glycosyltransferase family 2 protein n=1 Tax=uncultured Psychrobacter sp. TaxID=259303 RepID=UPI0030D90D54|tara:strand:- start:6103 stop:7047 length:945 start_codon:yes stop_codon:yes gene_type:complete